MSGQHKSAPMQSRERHWKPRVLIAVLVGVGVLLFAGANVHLIHVAVSSQPDCVPHLKAAGAAPGTFRAAKSAC